MNRAILLSLPMMAACGPQTLVGAETTGDAGETTKTESPTSTTGTASSSGGTTSSTSEPGSEEDSWPGSPTDMGGPEVCDVFLQDCPAGQKCSPYANDGGGAWNDAKCVEVMEDPAQVGEACFVVGNGVSGIDNCEAGAYCWDVDPRTNMGACVAFCTGSPEAPMCEPGYYCSISGAGVIAFCFAYCDPLAQDCVLGACIASPYRDEFLCVLDASGEEGQLHDPCAFVNVCDPGLFCADPSSAEECDQQQVGCCEPFCDLTAAESCPGSGQVCQPWWPPGEAPDDYEDVGFCAVPR